MFSALLPIAKKDVVLGRFLFCVFIELCSFVLMALATAVRMTALSDAVPYLVNALMNANPFALGAALLLFGLFNRIFAAGFYRTGYKLTGPFVTWVIVCFVVIGLAEAAHYVPGFGALNAFGTEHLGLQLVCLLVGAVLFVLLTLWGLKVGQKNFEKVDL